MAEVESGNILTAYEAERLIEGLRPLTVDDVGSARWSDQHEAIEKLNLQAHFSAKSNRDEFVIESLISFDKLPVLIHDLLVIEAYKDKVWPLVKPAAAKLVASTKPYFILYHEATLVNLFELVLFHKHACLACGDAIVELVDYCHRKMIYLLSRDVEDLLPKSRSAKDAMEESREQSLEDQRVTIEYSVSMCALGLVRSLAEYCPDLPLGVMTNMLDKYDFIYTLIELMEKQPWRKIERGVVSKWEDGKFRQQESIFVVTKMDAQVWLALFYLVCEPACARRYQYNTFRRDQLVKLRRHFNEILFDQIPPLLDLHRAVETLSVTDTPATLDKAALLLETIAEIRETIYRNTNWEAVAARHIREVFKENDAEHRRQTQSLADLYSQPGFAELAEDPKCSNCGKPAVKRCSQCKYEWYCGRECQVTHWKQHKPICQILMKAGENKDQL